MPIKTITITTAKWTRIKEAFASVGIPEIEDPEDSGIYVPKYTEAQWVFFCSKRFVARKVRKYEKDRQGRDNAPAYDEDMITIT